MRKTFEGSLSIQELYEEIGGDVIEGMIQDKFPKVKSVKAKFTQLDSANMNHSNAYYDVKVEADPETLVQIGKFFDGEEIEQED